MVGDHDVDVCITVDIGKGEVGRFVTCVDRLHTAETPDTISEQAREASTGGNNIGMTVVVNIGNRHC
ncbi:MAG: hypothetical protein WD114_06275 [Phycisphaerales bacterium]